MKRFHFTVLIGIGLMLFAGLTRWQTIDGQPLIMTDGQGYYAYLPAVLIYHDLQFSFVDSVNAKYYPADKRARFIVPGESGNVNKYYVGTALMQAPFFVAGYVLSLLAGVPADGYSWPFQLMVGVAAICYLVLGLRLLNMALLNMGFRKKQAMASVVVLLFGTDLLYYTLYEPGMSHVFSFFTVSAFLYYVQRAVLGEKSGTWVPAALALGLTVLIRPTNGLIALSVPAIAGGGLNTLGAMRSLFNNKRILFFSVLVFSATLAVQIIIYMVQTGRPFVWSYEGEGFNFMSPEVINVLFSYRKGLFVYSPVLLLSAAGMISGISEERARYVSLLVFLSAVTWVISSWWMWYYGGCFGQRAFIEYLPFFGIGLAFAFRSGWGVLRPRFFYIASCLLVAVQIVQTYQYVNNILPFDNITKAKYWSLFLRVGDDLAWYYPGYEGQNSYRAADSLLVTNGMEYPLGWDKERFTSEEKHSGNASSEMSSEDWYGITYRKPVSELMLQPDMVRVSCWTMSDSWATGLALVCTLEDSTGAAYYWEKHPLRPQFKGRNEWSRTTALFRCGPPRDPADSFVIYPMRSDGARVYIDDLEISFIHAE